MHSSVLVIGASNQEELEKALAPFYQLGCTQSQEESKNDPRAAFEVEYTKEEGEKQYEESVIEKPTKDQFTFFRDNFMEISDEETCRNMYAEKKGKKNSKHTPNGYTGEDFAYGNVKISDEYGFILISEEKMPVAKKWVKENSIDFYSAMHNSCKEDFIVKYPDAHTYMTSDMEWNEEKQGYGYYNNPNGFWDWYQVGGRWVGFFAVKEGTDRKKAVMGDPSMLMQFSEEEAKGLRDKADVLTVGDIDFDKMEEIQKEYASKNWDEMWEMINDHRSDKTDEEVEQRFREIMNSTEGETKEEYVERSKGISVASIVMAGEWFDHEKDGYYRCASDGLKGGMIAKELTMLLKNMQPETPLMLVDCHR